MAEMPTRTSATKKLMDCPACHNPVVARMAMDLHLGALEPSPGGSEPASVEATVSLVGLSIQHDCTPTIPRNERTAP
jgi:hypothetical protein